MSPALAQGPELLTPGWAAAGPWWYEDPPERGGVHLPSLFFLPEEMLHVLWEFFNTIV